MEIGMVRSIKENYRWGTGMVCGIPNGYNQGSHWVWGGCSPFCFGKQRVRRG